MIFGDGGHLTGGRQKAEHVLIVGVGQRPILDDAGMAGHLEDERLVVSSRLTQPHIRVSGHVLIVAEASARERGIYSALLQDSTWHSQRGLDRRRGFTRSKVRWRARVGFMGDTFASAPRSSFLRYWLAAAISSFGSAVTAEAMPVLVVQILGATPFEVGVVNAAQFVPYAVLGIIAGVYTDRWRRKPVLVWANVGRALSLGVIPILWLVGGMHIWMLVIALLSFGAFSGFGFAATQSLLPRLVPRARLRDELLLCPNERPMWRPPRKSLITPHAGQLKRFEYLPNLYISADQAA